MFKPQFSYTSKIVNNLVEIASARAIILTAYLVPKWEVSLRREALIRATHASTAIEGNPLTLDEVSKLAQGRQVTATRKAKQEVLNYLHVLEKIDEFPEDGVITEQSILAIHKALTRETLDNPEWEGRYREIQVVVGNRITGEVIFTPPPPDEVPRAMADFVRWLNAKPALDLHPVLVAGISHYEFVRIHPFVDGNGRAARALATLILYLRGFDIKRFFALDDYYDSDRAAYYAALNSVSRDASDLSAWLEYFTEGVLLSLSKVKERALQLSLDKRKRNAKGQIALSERQMRIIEHIQSNGRITSGEIQKMFGISRQATHTELKHLMELDIIEQKGAGKSTYYVMK
jgi:Fic family protein